MRSTVDDELQRYFSLQGAWIMDLILAAQPAAVSGGFPDDKFLKEGVEKWERDYPGFKFTDLAVPHCEILSDGRQINPPNLPAAPVPPKWFRELSPEQRTLWENLRRAVDANENSASIQTALEKFRKSNPSGDAMQAASYLLRPPEQIIGNSEDLLPTETGLSFQEIACCRLLSATNAQLTTPLLQSVGWQIIDHASIVSPKLLELAEGLTNRADAVLRQKVFWLQQFWDGQSKTRDWLAPLRKLPGMTNYWNPPAFWAHWTGGSAGGALAFFEPATFTNMGSDADGVPFAGHGYEVLFVPREVAGVIFARALEENKFFIPEYARVVMTVEGKPLPLSGDKNPSQEQALLGAAAQKIGAAMCPDAANLELRFYLNSREQMLSVERRRARLLGLVVLASTFAAIVGLLAAYRAFRREQRSVK